MGIGVYYADDLPFFPDKIFLKYQMNGENWQKGEAYLQNIDLLGVDGDCESDGIILPRVNKAAEIVVNHFFLPRLLV